MNNRQRISLVLAALLLLQSPFAFSNSVYADIKGDDAIAGIAFEQLFADSESEAGRPSPADFIDISAKSFALADEKGQILYSRAPESSVQMASITKIMTAIVALESTPLNTEMLVTRGATTVEGSSAELPEGAKLTLHELLYCMLIPSGNDAAVAISENISGRQSDYTALMNNKAQELGLNNTHFTDPSGLDENDQYSTALDTLKLARYAMSNSTFREIVGQPTHTLWIDGEEVELVSSNDLYFSHSASLEVTGIKTGTNDNAGFCLVASSKRAGAQGDSTTELTAALFNANVKPDVIADANALLSWGYEHYKQVELVSASETVGDISLSSWFDRTVKVKANNKLTADVFEFAGTVSAEFASSEFEGAVDKGQRIGQLVYKQNGNIIASCDLIADESVPLPNFFEAFIIFWQKMWFSIIGGNTSAPSELYIPHDFTV